MTPTYLLTALESLGNDRESFEKRLGACNYSTSILKEALYEIWQAARESDRAIIMGLLEVVERQGEVLQAISLLKEEDKPIIEAAKRLREK